MRVHSAPLGIIAALWRLPQYDEHVKAYRWFLHTRHSAFSLHVQDYYMHKELSRV